MKRNYGTNGNNGRSAGFQRAWLPGKTLLEDLHTGSLRTDRYFRLFRNLSSIFSNNSRSSGETLFPIPKMPPDASAMRVQ